MIDPNPNASTEALRAKAALQALSLHGESVVIHTSGATDSSTVVLPAEARSLLLQILSHMATGVSVAVVPVASEVTAQEAAEILGVSRPFVVRLIDEGKLACRMVGTHRRIPMNDLLAFKQANRAERRAIAAQLSAEAQELGFDYK